MFINSCKELRKYHHDLEGSLRTLRLFIEFRESGTILPEDESYHEIRSQVEEALSFMEKHIQGLRSQSSGEAL